MLNIPFTCISDRLYIAHRTNCESGDHYNQTHQISVVTTIKFPLPPQWLVTTNPTLSPFYSVLSVFLGTVYRKAVRRFLAEMRPVFLFTFAAETAGVTCITPAMQGRHQTAPRRPARCAVIQPSNWEDGSCPHATFDRLINIGLAHEWDSDNDYVRHAMPVLTVTFTN